MSKSKTTEVVLSVPAIEYRKLNITVIGDTPMIQHRWSEKAKKEMLDKMMGKGRKGRPPKDPEGEYSLSAHIIDEKPGDRDRLKAGDWKGIKFGFPAQGFKNAMVGACRLLPGVIKMTEARGAFHVLGYNGGELVEIESIDGPNMREDVVRIQMTTDLRYRAEFKKWKANLVIEYIATVISAEQLMVMVNLAGFGSGAGDWRPERDGPFGRFHVAKEGEL